MKKLLKSEVCESRTVFMRPTDGLKMAEKSKFPATVHAQYMNSSFCHQLCVQKTKEKEKKKRGKTQRRIQRKTLNPNGHHVAHIQCTIFFFLKKFIWLSFFIIYFYNIKIIL